MTNEEIEKELLFERIRICSSQWRITYKNKEVAIVTENRYSPKQRYTLTHNNGELLFETREEATSYLCDFLRKEIEIK